MSGVHPAPIRRGLDLLDEATLREVEPEALLSAPADPPSRAVVTPARPLPPAQVDAWFAGRVGGPAAARWAPDDWRREGETTLVRAGDAVWSPREGAVLVGGRAIRASVAHRLTADPALAGLAEARALARQAGRSAVHGPAAVFMGRGARLNYGHFVLDALTGLLALEEAGVVRERPVLAPPLRRWQRGLLALAFPRTAVVEVGVTAMRLADVVLPTTMDHHLHWPNGLTARVAERVREGLAAARPRRSAGLRLYVSRRGLPMRVMVGEADLERRLRAMGFRVVHAERLSAVEQAGLARDAEVIVGPTGAALANALFASPQARVIEIQPECYASAWVPAFRRLTGGEWFGYVAAAPAPRSQAPLALRLRRGFRFAYAPDLDDLSAFIRSHL